MAWCQARGCFKQPRHLARGEDVWLGPLVVGRESRWIREETLWLGAPPVSAEVIDLEHADAAHTRSEVLLRSAPTLKSRRSQVFVHAGLLMKKAIQRLQRPGRRRETASQGPLQSDVSIEDRCQCRKKRRGCGHGRTAFTALPLPGTASETSRRSPVANRRYIDVLSAVRCPRMSPIVLSGVPFLSRWTANEWRLCRARHKRHYAEFRTMPSTLRE